jgi:bifunctional non-homologous end joining protein LigD
MARPDERGWRPGAQSPPPADPLAADRLTWRPQRPAPVRGRTPAITDPLLEPHWDGRHVLLHFDLARATTDGEPWLRLIDSEGEDVTGSDPAVAALLGRSVLAVDAVIDGFLTDQATRTGEGASIAISPNIPRFPILAPRGPEPDVAPIQGHDRDNLVAFVAVDLLVLDGQPLFDIPLLERKRILDGLLETSDRVRVSVYTRPPLNPWLASWKSAGFAGAVMKAANSRYRPNAATDEWTVVTAMPRGGRR